MQKTGEFNLTKTGAQKLLINTFQPPMRLIMKRLEKCNGNESHNIRRLATQIIVDVHNLYKSLFEASGMIVGESPCL